MDAALTLDARAVLRRTALVLLVHAVLLAAWPLVRWAYAPAFRTLGAFAVGVTDPLPGAIEARFEARGPDDGLLAHHVARMDTRVRLRHRELAGSDSLVGASSFFHGWWPTTVLAALFAGASAAPGRARRRSFGWALLALHVLLGLRLAFLVYHGYAGSTIDGRPAVALGPEGARALQLAWHFACDEPLTNYLVPLALFGLLAPRSAAR